MIKKAEALTILAMLIMVLISNPALAWKKPYKEGIKYLDAHAYEQAIDKFNESLSSPNISERNANKVQTKLTEAKSKAAGELFRRGIRLSDDRNLRDAVEAFARASEYAPDNEQYRARYLEEKNTLDGVTNALTRDVTDAIANKAWDQAIRKLESYTIYESSFPDISSQVAAIKQQAAQYYVNLSDRRLNDGNYRDAYNDIGKAATYSADQTVQNKKNARHHLLMSEQAWISRNYLKAYEEITKGLQYEPDNTELKNYEDRFLDEWSGILYNEAVQANNRGDYATTITALTQLSRFKPGFLNTEEMLAEVQGSMVSTYYSKAEAIMNREDSDYIGLALAYYLLVKEQYSHPYRDIDSKIVDAKKRLRKELEFRISMDFDNQSQEPGAGELVKEQILARIKNSPGLRNLTILDRELIDDILREQGLGQGFLDESTALQVKKIKGIQAGVKGEVIKLTVIESGRERPSYGSSRYVSGKRWVPNPDYQQVQADVSAAQQNVLQAQADANRAQAEQNQIMQQQAQLNQTAGANSMSALVSGLSAMSGALSQGNLNNARNELADAQNRLARTPMQIEENIESDYRYEVFNLALNAEVVISFKIINYTTSEIGQVHTVRKTASLTDTYIPGDPGKGVASDPIDFPPVDEFKNSLVSAAIDDTFEAMLSELSQNSESWFQLAQRAERDNLDEDAIENYMRYIYSAPDLSDERVQDANNFIYDKVGLYVVRRRR